MSDHGWVSQEAHDYIHQLRPASRAELSRFLRKIREENKEPTPMSSQPARARILRYAEQNKPFLDPACDPETGFFVDDPEAHLSGLLDEYAHELAEKQRALKREHYDWFTGAWEEGRDDAADLIDPNVSSKEPTP